MVATVRNSETVVFSSTHFFGEAESKRSVNAQGENAFTPLRAPDVERSEKRKTNAFSNKPERYRELLKKYRAGGTLTEAEKREFLKLLKSGAPAKKPRVVPKMPPACGSPENRKKEDSAFDLLGRKLNVCFKEKDIASYLKSLKSRFPSGKKLSSAEIRELQDLKQLQRFLRNRIQEQNDGAPKNPVMTAPKAKSSPPSPSGQPVQ
jgi:hypothetical protein